MTIVDMRTRRNMKIATNIISKVGYSIVREK